MANVINSALPADSEHPSLGASRIRDFKDEVNALLTIDHDITDAASKGMHPQVSLPVRGTNPANASGYAFIYSKTVAGSAELFCEDAAGNVIQLTSGGNINVSSGIAVLMTGNQTVAGIKTFSSSPIVPTATSTGQAVSFDGMTTAIAAASAALGARTPNNDGAGALVADGAKIYQATGDGILVMTSNFNSSTESFIKIGTSSPPTTKIARGQHNSVGKWGTLTVSVAKDEYVQMQAVSDGGDVYNISWQPLGSGGLHYISG